MKKNRYGYYFYRVYDAKTNELLAQGDCKEVAKKMMWNSSYPQKLADLNRTMPNRKPRYERLEREWVESIYEVYDRKKKQTFKGNYEECAKTIVENVGHELKMETIRKYISGGSERFRIKRLKNV